MVVFCLLLGNADIRVAQLIMPPLFAFLRKCSAISQGKVQLSCKIVSFLCAEQWKKKKKP